MHIAYNVQNSQCSAADCVLIFLGADRCFQQGEGPSRGLIQALCSVLLREGSLTALMLHCSKLILIDLLPLGRNKHQATRASGGN